MDTPNEVIDCTDCMLRRWRAHRDHDDLLRVSGEAVDHLRPWMAWASHHGPDHIRGFLSSAESDWESGEAHHYAITVAGAPVGSCCFYRTADPRGRALGYWLHPAATGRGIVTRAAAALAAEAFALRDVEYVEIVHDQANTAGAAVPRRLGFTEIRRRTRADGDHPAAPGDCGTDVIWRLPRPAAAPA